jgi:hypothetical protein
LSDVRYPTLCGLDRTSLSEKYHNRTCVADAVRPVANLFLDVICKGLDHAAFGDATTGALGDHALQVGLWHTESVDPRLYLVKAGAGDHILDGISWCFTGS